MQSAHSEVDSAQRDAALGAALARGVAHAVGALAKNIFASCAAWSAPPQEDSPGLVLEHLIIAAKGAGGGSGSAGSGVSGASGASGASASASAVRAAFTPGQRHNCALARLLAELRDALERSPEECGAAFARVEARAGESGEGAPPPRSVSDSGADTETARTSEAGQVVASVRKALRPALAVLGDLEMAILAPLFRSVLGAFEVAPSDL